MQLRSLLKHDRFWTVLSALMALHMLPSSLAVNPVLADRGPTWLGLDDSARMAMNYAWMNGWNWGSDIVYTYGPLSFLSTRIGWGIPAPVFIIADIALIANFFLIIRDFILGSTHRWLATGVAFLLTLHLPGFTGNALAWVLMIFTLYWMHRSYEAPRWWHFAAMTALITAAFYIKLNTGLFIIAFLAAYLVLMVAQRRLSLQFAAVTCIGLTASLWICALLFRVSLPEYVRGAVEVIKGYNDLLYLYEDHPGAKGSVLLLFAGLCAWLIIPLPRMIRNGRHTLAFLAIAGCAYLFLLKKQALFRNDTQHISEFFLYAPLVLLTGARSYIMPRRELSGLLAIAGIIIACHLPDRERLTVMSSLAGNLEWRYTTPYRYAGSAAAYDPAAYTDQAEKRRLPPRVLQRIGRHTVDVFPWDANYILQHRLTYHPRPCFQTFQANSDYLQRINYRFYEQRGPQFVIYDYDAIDNAYPFNDAPVLNLFLAGNYHLADTFFSNDRRRILLQKNAAKRPVSMNGAGRMTGRLNQPLGIGDADFLRLDVTYTPLGKLQTFWDKPSPLLISYQRPDGEWLTYKTSTELLKTGIYAGRLIRTIEDYSAFVQGDTASLERVQAVRLTGDPRHYSGEIGVTYFRTR